MLVPVLGAADTRKRRDSTREERKKIESHYFNAVGVSGFFDAKNHQKGMVIMCKQYIYVMQSNSLYKIGISENPSKRLKQLQTGNPNIKLIWSSDGVFNASEIESKIHNHYKKFNFVGEWFEVENIEEVIACIKHEVLKNGLKTKKYEDDFEEQKAEIISKLFGTSEVEKMALENNRIQEFTYCIFGWQQESDYSDLVYKAVFGKSAKQLREEYGISKTDNLRDLFSEEELAKVQSIEMIVSGLVNCGWGYDDVKDFITNGKKKLITA
jgi:hypothetical protein